MPEDLGLHVTKIAKLNAIGVIAESTVVPNSIDAPVDGAPGSEEQDGVRFHVQPVPQVQRDEWAIQAFPSFRMIRDFPTGPGPFDRSALRRSG